MLIREIQRRENLTLSSGLASYPEKIQQILVARGIQDTEQLNYGLAGLLPPSGLKNIEQAAAHLFAAIRRQESILIIGDFDADGATSSAVMVKALTRLGATRVNFLVPDRFRFGYGLSVKLVEHAATLNPDLIVTVDNGIANFDGVAKAREFGIPVIITDHHLSPERLPDALSIVNPNQTDDEFESKNLAGVGVAFYLMLVLRQQMREAGWFAEQKLPETNLAELLDIVALGTVADVVVLDKNNRILVEQGLKRIRSGLACPGIQAILQVAGRDYRKCQASDLGFSVGPRLNAAGRLDDMSIGIECLLSETLEQALVVASRLDQLNKSRKNIEQEMLLQADADLKAYLQHHSLEQGERPSAMCLFDAGWHQGVIGILASRVKEKINRPVIVFASDDDPQFIKGSARSVKGVHIRDVLALLDARHPHLLEKFGGHAMAAGLSLQQKYFNEFSQLFHDAVVEHLAGDAIRDELLTDGGLASDELQMDFASQLRAIGPWGQGFPEPLFDNEFEVVTSRIVGEDHLKLVVNCQGISVDGIYFRCPELLRAQPGDKVRLVYKLDINEFRGNQTLQLMVEQLEILSKAPV